MRLGRLANAIPLVEFNGDPDLQIIGLAYDSRRVKPGYLFVALRGHALDGHEFIEEAIIGGAVGVIAEDFGAFEPQDIAMIRVTDSRAALSGLAKEFYDRPFEGMNLIGITGTNGKTTTSYLLESILVAAGRSPGVIGTINYRFAGNTQRAAVTTPESLDLMRILREMRDSGVTDVIMEVSSHAIDQGRIRGCPFQMAIFTNLSRDHLDYHGSMEGYFETKSLLFRGLKGQTQNKPVYAVINGDDPKGKKLMQMTGAEVISYGFSPECPVRATKISASKTGLSGRMLTPKGEMEIHSSLLGEFNVYNILAAIAAAFCLGINPDVIPKGISKLDGVPGRMEIVKQTGTLTIIVDYAHTPDALLNVLKALRSLTPGRLLTVFGCGGDRDSGKRPEMGLVAGKNSEFVVITSDNPRTESPTEIISQVEQGVCASGLKHVNGALKDAPPSGYIVEPDRAKAIRKAVAMAEEADVILIAGKGHEDYQIIGTKRNVFDDREEAFQAATEVL